MSEPMIINTLEQLKQLANEKGIIEIVARGKHKRFVEFKQVLVNNLQQGEGQEAVEKVMQALNKNNGLLEKMAGNMGQLAKLQQFGLVMSGLNLCATCAGFAILNQKLDDMSAEISQQFGKLTKVVKTGNDIHTNYELREIVGNHTNMLDCRKKKEPYNEDQMRALVDQEYNMLQMLIELFMEDVSANNKNIVFSIVSMMSMLSASLCYFDELYYMNNHEKIDGNDVWHMDHNKWMGVYTTLSSQAFRKRLEDYCAFETELDTRGVDLYCISFMDQVISLSEEVSDNQELIQAIGNIELLAVLRAKTDQEVEEEIRELFANEQVDLSDEAVAGAYQAALQQVALA